MKEKGKDKLWLASVELNEAEKGSLLGFLFGWCGNDEHFFEGVKRFMTRHKEKKNV